MTDFTQQLLTYEGEPMVQREVGEDKKGKKTVTPVPMTIQRCAKFALLDIVEFNDGLADELFTAKGHQRRWHLWNKIEKDPSNVELGKEERELFEILLPLKFEVLIVGQIMDLL